MSATINFPCRLCGGRNLRFYYALGNDRRFRYYKCDDCALVNYDLSTGVDQEQYTDDFIDPTDDSHKRNFDKDQSFRFLQRHVKPPVSFLDIGCGFGRLLYRAKNAGWQAKGLELSAGTAARVSKLLGVEVMAGDFLQMEVGPDDAERYDVVSLRHVLEHLPDSLGAMARIKALMKPGGLLLLELPNVEGWAKKLHRFLVARGWHKREYADDFMAGHCNEYCRESMDNLARRSGFELVVWETYSSKPAFDFLLNRFPIGTKARALLRAVN